MCGFLCVAGKDFDNFKYSKSLFHRGPDSNGKFISIKNELVFHHERLKIIDLTDKGSQPFYSADCSIILVFNGAIYNFIELRKELKEYNFESNSDTEVIVASYLKWGEKCLEKFNGMFSFILFDQRKNILFGARDRFGVKPLYFQKFEGNYIFASEIQAIHKLTNSKIPNFRTWSDYLSQGIYDHNEQTFWQDVEKIMPGSSFTFNFKVLKIKKWYDISNRVNINNYDNLEQSDALKKFEELFTDSINIRLRSDVEIGFCLSSGLDSSLLLKAIGDKLPGPFKTFTYTTKDNKYDEYSKLSNFFMRDIFKKEKVIFEPSDISEYFKKITFQQTEPFGGYPNIGMYKIFERASENKIKVMFDGNGLDEAFAGYSYYSDNFTNVNLGSFQGSSDYSFCDEYLNTDFSNSFQKAEKFTTNPANLREFQILDITKRKLPRALRFLDLISMNSSIEVRNPFLDYRLMEFGVGLNSNLKLGNLKTKILPRIYSQKFFGNHFLVRPKQSTQTPQSEWIKFENRAFLEDMIDALSGGVFSNIIDIDKVMSSLKDKKIKNNFYLYQIMSLGQISLYQKS